MKARKICKRVVALLLSIWLGISCMSATAFAGGKIDINREVSMSIYFGENTNGFSGVNFNVYYVARMSEWGDFSLSGDFRNYPVRFENLDSSGWRALAQTLSAYVQRDGLRPLRQGKTDAHGYVSFEKLTVGLYLVVGGTYINQNKVYTPEPMLVSLPSMGEGNKWVYNTKLFCKYDSEIVPNYVVRKVQKVWKDDGNEKKRPQSISVQLLENGKVVDTVVLNRNNNWEYTWKNLNGSSVWQVVEAQTPAGYTVSVVREGNVFVMTNTFPSKIPSKLPQTGMLWFPIPILICGGLLFMVVGLFIRRR
ncbi:MAG: Cna B-type domain-containing protein [Massiliimalia sp.]|jgi:hypothetical protein